MFFANVQCQNGRTNTRREASLLQFMKILQADLLIGDPDAAPVLNKHFITAQFSKRLQI